VDLNRFSAAESSTWLCSERACQVRAAPAAITISVLDEERTFELLDKKVPGDPAEIAAGFIALGRGMVLQSKGGEAARLFWPRSARRSRRLSVRLIL
jgi:hypothetical protein